MQNQAITTAPMHQTISPLGMEIEPLKPANTAHAANVDNAIFENTATKAANTVKKLGRDKEKKAQVLVNFKLQYPAVDLRNFVATMCANNFDDDNFENKENMALAEHLEDNFNLKKLGKTVKKATKQVVKVGGKTLKVVTPAIAIAASVVGTPAVGAGVAAGLGAVNKVTSKLQQGKAGEIVKTSKQLGLTNKVTETLIKNPSKVSISTVQAVAPTTGVEKTLAPLVAFEGAMKKMLASKGTTTNENTSLEDLAGMFHQKIVLAKSSYDENWCKNDPSYYENFEYFDENHLDASTAGKVVSDIVAFFKKVKTEPATTSEKVLADDIKKLEVVNAKEKALDASEAVVSNEIKAKGFSTQHIIIFAVIAIGAFVLLKK